MSTVRVSITMACLTIAVVCGLPAQSIRDLPLSKGMLAFDGRGTLGAFTGISSEVKGHLVGAAAMAGVRGWVEAPVRSLVTGNGKRDRDMYSSLEAEKYPLMRFDLERVDSASASGDSIAVKLLGQLTIHGQARQVAIPGWVWLRPASASFRGSLPIDARDYGIGGLSKMLGVLKMNPKVLVRIEVVFEE
jgi:polyisoprenoid-binding protein YceI